MKIALITGGSAGIGRAAAIEVARRGIGVVITYRRHELEAKEAAAAIEAEGGSAVALALDVADTGSFPAFKQTFTETLRDKWDAETFRYLVNNAGIGGGMPFGDVSEEMFDNF